MHFVTETNLLLCYYMVDVRTAAVVKNGMVLVLQIWEVSTVTRVYMQK